MEREFYHRLEQWHQQGDHAKIVEAIEAVPLPRRDYEMISLYARALNNMQRYGEAIEQLIGAAEQGQEDPLWYFRLAYAYYHLDMEEQAKSLLEQALELAPGDEDARQLLKACDYWLARKKPAPSGSREELLEDLGQMLPDVESFVADGALQVPAWGLCIRPELGQLDRRGAVVNYRIENPGWDRPILECSAGMGGDAARALQLAEDGFRYCMLDGLRAMAEGDAFAWVNSEFAGREHSWIVYRSNLIGMGQTPQDADFDQFWSLLGEDLIRRLGNQKFCYVKVYGAKFGTDVTGECRINDVPSPALSEKVADLVRRWDTDAFGAQKQFYYFCQRPVTTLPYPHTYEQLRSLTAQAIRLFGQCVRQGGYEQYLDKLAQLTGDASLAEELYSFLPEMCAQNAYPAIRFPETVTIVQQGEEHTYFKDQLASYYVMQQALLDEMQQNEEAAGLYGYFIAVSSVYSVICSAKEKGADLTEEGGSIDLHYGFTSRYRPR